MSFIMQNNNIHVAYVLHDKTGRYCKILATSIYSLLYNSSRRVVIHLLHDKNLNEEDRKRFTEMIGNLVMK